MASRSRSESLSSGGGSPRQKVVASGARHNGARSKSRSVAHSRSASRSASRDRRRVGNGAGRRNSHSRSPLSHRRRHADNPDNPAPSKCVGCFGLSVRTRERDLHDLFSRYGDIEDVQLVYDNHTGSSRGFAFIYFKDLSDAKEAKEKLHGSDVDGRNIRCDFSVTKRAHTPTPGVYLGKPTSKRDTGSYRGGGYRGGYRGGNGGGGSHGYNDRSDERDRYEDRGYSRRSRSRSHDRGYDRGGYERGGGYDRGYERSSGGYERNGGYDRSDRGGYDRSDRGGYDRGGYDRGGYDRGYNRRY